MAEVAAQESLAPLPMKWPFVSRARFELLQHNFDEQRKQLHREESLHTEARSLYNSILATSSSDRARYDSLLEKFCAMKLQGGVIPEPVVVRPPKEADPVIQQINTLSAGKPGLRAQMMKQLNTDRSIEQLDDVEIMRKIEMGVVNEDGVPA